MKYFYLGFLIICLGVWQSTFAKGFAIKGNNAKPVQGNND